MATVQFGAHLVEGDSLDFTQPMENNFCLWIKGGPFHETAIKEAKIIIVDREIILTGVRWGRIAHDSTFIEYNGTYTNITLNSGKDKWYDKIKEQRDSAQAAFRNLQKDYQKVLQAPLLLLKLADAASSLGKQVELKFYNSKAINIVVGNRSVIGNDLENVIRCAANDWLNDSDTKEVVALKNALKQF